MRREYDTGTAEAITYFTGIEIEKTPAFGMKTLFVVGIQDSLEIVKLAQEYQCEHIYFGANQSFPRLTKSDIEVWNAWGHMIRNCLGMGYWCTLDFDVTVASDVLEYMLTVVDPEIVPPQLNFVEHRRFIPQVSVKLPYLTQLGHNATIKLDDKDFDATNPGVWCHRLHDLTTTESFTDWDQYSKDEIIK